MLDLTTVSAFAQESHPMFISLTVIPLPLSYVLTALYSLNTAGFIATHTFQSHLLTHLVISSAFDITPSHSTPCKHPSPCERWSYLYVHLLEPTVISAHPNPPSSLILSTFCCIQCNFHSLNQCDVLYSRRALDAIMLAQAKSYTNPRGTSRKS